MKPPKPASPSRLPLPSPAPTGALERPAKLKKWAFDLVRILNQEKPALFKDWQFGPGSLTEADLTRTLKKITGCGSVVELRSAVNRETGEVGSPALHAANFCGQHTVCPFCAGRVQDRRGVRFKDPILKAAGKYPYAYLLTATLPPAATWRADLNQLISAWKDFRRLGQRRKHTRTETVDGVKVRRVTYTRDPGEFGKIGAGLAKVELKRGKDSGLPHCHYHALVFTEAPLDFRVWSKEEKKKPMAERIPLYRIPSESDPRGWVPASKLTYEWSKVTDFRARSFEVSPLKYLEKDRHAGVSYEESIFRQSKEVLKYATKFDSAPKQGTEKLFAQDFVAIKDATYARRLFHTYGDFYGVGGSDFVGGGPHLFDKPLIFESRWRTDHYSPLRERSRPVFMNTDKTPRVTERITALNRVQGGIRRVRSAIVNAKNQYRATGCLAPAVLIQKDYFPEGGFSEKKTLLEMPLAVVQYPWDDECWERWIDSAMDAGRAAYAQAREELSLEDREAFTGSKDDLLQQAAQVRRAERNMPSYEFSVIQKFLEVLAASSPPS